MTQVDVKTQSRTAFLSGETATNVTFSDFGSKLLMQSDTDLKMYSGDGKKLLSTWKGAAHNFKKMSALLRPDGEAVLIVNDEENKGAALIWDWQSQAETELFRDRPHAQVPEWSADGKHVFVHDWLASSIYDAASGERVYRVGGVNSIERLVFTPDGRRGVVLFNKSRLGVIDIATSKSIYSSPESDVKFTNLISISRDSRFAAIVQLKPPAAEKAILIWRLPDDSAVGPVGK